MSAKRTYLNTRIMILGPPPLRDKHPPPQLLEFHLFCYTLYFHKAALLPWRNCLVTQLLCHKEWPYAFLLVRNSG